jgi:hypothetical protein
MLKVCTLILLCLLFEYQLILNVHSINMNVGDMLHCAPHILLCSLCCLKATCQLSQDQADYGRQRY